MKKWSMIWCLTWLSLLSPCMAKGQMQDDPESATHGMLVMGSERIFISHLPMFSIPHRYQAIWQISFGEEGDRIYRQHYAQQGPLKTIYTLAPKEQFPLKDLMADSRSFQADVFIGHFEREGHEVLLKDVEVQLLGNVHFHRFETTDQRPKSLRYIFFGVPAKFRGGPSELFLAHEITVAPNYDQILMVSADVPVNRGGQPIWGQGVKVELSQRGDAAKLRPGDNVEIVIKPPLSDASSVRQLDGPVKVLTEYYLEKGELSESVLR